MISDKYKCIFVHIPKTGGQSVEHVFLNLHNLDWDNRSPLLLRHNDDPKRGPERLAHLTASEYVDCEYISQDQFDAYYKFAFVRNPFSRLVSAYKFRKYHMKMNFKDFVISGLPAKNYYSGAYRHIIPQYDYIYNEKDELLVDFVGKLENFQNDFDVICSKLKINDSTLPHINSSSGNSSKGIKNKIKTLFNQKKTENKHYSSYYDDEIKKIVTEMYKKDLETFGYTFEMHSAPSL